MTQADLIKILAVVTATPRWVGALLAAEGLRIPDDWLFGWTIFSMILSAAMAGVEGWAFAYVFAAWRRTRSPAVARNLLILAAFAACAFIVVLAPYIAAQVRGVSVADVLRHDAALYVWASAVAASTITIVASVGYAQKAPQAGARPTQEPQPNAYTCAVCARSFASQQALAAHSRAHKKG